MLPTGWADLPDGWRSLCDPHDEAHSRFWRTWHHERAEAIGCVYDERAADVRVAFFANLKLVKGSRYAGKPFNLLPHAEHQIVRPFFGYKEAGTDPPERRADIDPLGTRQFRRADHWVAKKNAKTTLGAGLGAEALFLEREPGVEVYACAADRDQAGRLYESLAPMISNQPTLDALSKRLDSVKRIIVPSLNGFLHVNSSEAYTKHGSQQFAVLADELHAWPGREYWTVMTQGAFASRDEWILYVMSTPGFSMTGVGYEEFEYAQRVALGEVDDPRLLPAIHVLDQEDDWHDEANWYKANPALGFKGCGWPYALDIEDLRDEYRKALVMPSTEQEFRVLRLATWMSTTSRYFDMLAWRKCEETPSPLTGRPYYGGLDLSETQDITAYMRMAWDSDTLDVHGHYWLPAANIEERERRDRVPYREWARQGWITLTEGDIIDYLSVRNYVNETSARDGMPVEIGYDPYNARQICEVWLAGEDGHSMVPVRQGPQSLSDPTKRIKDLVASGKVKFGNDPVLRWMAENTVVLSDSNGNIKPNKAPNKQRLRIDGISALVTGLNRALVMTAPQQSVYETRGLLTL